MLDSTIIALTHCPAIQVFAHRFAWGKPTLTTGPNKWHEVFEYPFDSSVKRMSVIMESPGGKERKVFMKGAVEKVLAACDTILVEHPDGGEELLAVDKLDQTWHEQILANMEAMASTGLRCLALGTKDWDDSQVTPQDQEQDVEEHEKINPDGDEDDADDDRSDVGSTNVVQPPRKAVERGLTFLGLVGIYDPPRPESAPSVAQFKKASIRVHMLTGDHPGTATVSLPCCYSFAVLLRRKLTGYRERSRDCPRQRWYACEGCRRIHDYDCCSV